MFDQRQKQSGGRAETYSALWRPIFLLHVHQCSTGDSIEKVRLIQSKFIQHLPAVFSESPTRRHRLGQLYSTWQVVPHVCSKPGEAG